MAFIVVTLGDSKDFIDSCLDVKIGHPSFVGYRVTFGGSFVLSLGSYH